MALDMIFDVEALVIAIPNHSGADSPKKKIYIIEQIAYLLFDREKNICGEGHFFIRQPKTGEELAAEYKVSVDIVQTAIDNYERITGDQYIHIGDSDGATKYYDWCAIRKSVTNIAVHSRYVYAKGINLERSVFYSSFPIYDLGGMGCPRYPEPIHNPLSECKFFLTYAPTCDDDSNCSSSL